MNIKQGDTRRAIKATLKDDLGNAINLTDCSVIFTMTNLSRTVRIERESIINDALQGSVWFVFNAGDTDVPDSYRAEFKVTYPDSRVETFPNHKYISINIERKL